MSYERTRKRAQHLIGDHNVKTLEGAHLIIVDRDLMKAIVTGLGEGSATLHVDVMECRTQLIQAIDYRNKDGKAE